MAYFAFMPVHSSLSHRLGAHTIGRGYFTRRGEASEMLAFAYPLQGMSTSSMYCGTVPFSMDGRRESEISVRQSGLCYPRGSLPIGVNERRTRTGPDVSNGQSRWRRTVAVDDKRTSNEPEHFVIRSDNAGAVDERRTRNVSERFVMQSGIGRLRGVSPLFSQERKTRVEMTGNLCPINQPYAQTFGRKRKPETVLTQPKKLSTPQPSTLTSGLKRKHEVLVAPSKKLSTLTRQNTAEVPSNIEWGGGFSQESMGCNMNLYGSMQGLLELNEEGNILGLKSPVFPHCMDSPVFRPLGDNCLIHDNVGTNLNTSGSKSPVASQHKASPVPDANQVMELDTRLQGSMDGTLNIGEVGQSPGLKSPVTHDKTPRLASFGNCSKQASLGLDESRDGPLNGGLYNSNRVYPPRRVAASASPFLDSSRNECRLEDLGLNIDPYGSMSPYWRSAEEERVHASEKKKKNFESFLRSKVDKNEKEIACMREENLTLQEKLTRLGSERKDLEDREQLRSRPREFDSCDGCVGFYLPSPCASHSKYSLS